MKSVLISIQPKWCKLIANGKKTIEVRKTRPKLETPFKCYIYCTKGREPNVLFRWCKSNNFLKAEYTALNGKVIGEFVCDKIIELSQLMDEGYYIPEAHFGFACMTVAEAREYGQGKPLYAWHISNLVIYDKPKPLSKFVGGCKYPWDCGACCYYDREQFTCDKPIRPPQSWMYCESEVDTE